LKAGLTRSVCIDTQGWDTHSQNQLQNSFFENLFSPLTAFITNLKNTPGKAEGKTLFQETVVVVLSEMIRTPKLNAPIPLPILGETDDQWLLRFPGKDHWFLTNALILGGGVAGDRTIGGTDAYQKAKLVVMEDGSIDAHGTRGGLTLTHTNLVAGIINHLGVDYARYLPSKPLVLA
jgi:uncharacterized protein (DUF1501 family)